MVHRCAAGCDPALCLAATPLLNYDDAAVGRAARVLAAGARQEPERFGRIHAFVRDQIAAAWSRDDWSASTVLGAGYGSPAAKANLLAALARAMGLPARIHFYRVKKELVRHLVPHFVFALLPSLVSYAVAEVFVQGQWVAADELGPVRGLSAQLDRGVWAEPEAYYAGPGGSPGALAG